MKKVNILVFGTNAAVAVCDCGGMCGPSKPMKEEAENLKHVLIDKYGEVIDFTYVDVESEEMKEYPQIAVLLDKIRLPLTCLNGEPSFYGGFSPDMISDAIGKLLT
jgi:disulfide oxidoreductase YuzD